MAHSFVRQFVRPHHALARTLRDAADRTPGAAFLAACGSASPHAPLARRGVTSTGLLSDARLLALHGGGGDAPGSRLGWRRAVVVAPPPQPAGSALRGSTTLRGTRTLGGTAAPHARGGAGVPAAVGTTSMGALVCVSQVRLAGPPPPPFVLSGHAASLPPY